MTRALLVVALAAGCFRGAGDLTPFPCAADLTCPGGLACQGGSGVAECVHAALDATCTLGSDPTNCASAGAGVVCSATLAQKQPMGTNLVGSGSPIVPPIGACEEQCPCSNGRTCANGVCLVDCTSNAAACPTNTRCLPASTGAMLCVPNGIYCESTSLASSGARCTSTCAQKETGVGCPNMTSTCPLDSTCNADSTSCGCNIGRSAFDCSTDQPCNGNCGGGSWWCAPDVTTFDCNSDLDGIAVTCNCWDRSSKNVTCTDNVAGKSCEDLCAGR